MTDAIDITPEQRKTILDLLKRYLPDTVVWAYGSRVKWTSRPESDLDMVVFASPAQKRQVFDLKEAFEESDLPFRVDLFVWDEVPEDFKKNIETEHMVLQDEKRRVVGSEWKKRRLDELTELIVNCPHSTPKWQKEGVIVLRNQNIRNGRLDLSSPSFTNDDEYIARTKRATPQEGDIVLTREAPMGEVCQIPAGLKSCLGQRMVLIRASKERCDGRFLLYALQGPYVRNQIGWNEGTGSTVGNIRIPLIHAFEIPTPPLPTQRAIAHILGSLDDKIELNRQMNRTLEAMAQAIFKSWFIDFDPVRARRGELPFALNLPKEIADLFPDSFEDSELGKIPKGWEVKPIGDVIELAYGKSLPKNKRVCGQFPVYGSGGVTGFHNEHIVQGPGIIVGRKGTVGSVYWEERNFFPIDTVFYVNIKTLLPLYWVFLRLSLMDIQKLGADSAVPGVNRNSVYAQKWTVPVGKIVEKFQAISDGFLRQAEENRRQINSLSKTRDTLLPKLICGELPIPDAEKILEDAGV